MTSFEIFISAFTSSVETSSMDVGFDLSIPLVRRKLSKPF